MRRGRDGQSWVRRLRLSPRLLSYGMGPAALVVILFLRHAGLVARASVWLWIAVFVSTPILTAATEVFYQRQPTRIRLHLRIASHAAAVTTVIYLSGWGPVLVCAFAFVALENVSHDGSRTWRVTALWSGIGIAFGQVAIWRGWLPSFLSVPKGEALGLMGSFVLLFIIRMAGMTVEQKEIAESSLATSEDRFRSLVQKSSDTTLVIDADWNVTDASPAVVDLLGVEPDAVLGRSLLDLVHGDDRPLLEVKLASRLEAGDGSDSIEFRVEHTSGRWRHVEATLTDLRDRPSVAGFVVNVRDITERKEVETQLAFQALHDPLTGLPNRTLILDRAEQMLERSRRDHRPTAALFIDLDRFKDINDTLGHEAGDKVLQTIAERFSATLRASDTVGRGGVGGCRTRARSRAPPRGTARAHSHRRFRASAAADHGQHRHRLRRQGFGQRLAPRRRHRSLPGQGPRTRLRRALRSSDAGPRR
jgi:PAS domain S-box-containing protein